MKRVALGTEPDGCIFVYGWMDEQEQALNMVNDFIYHVLAARV